MLHQWESQELLLPEKKPHGWKQSSGGDHPVLLLVSLPLQVGGPHPVVHLQGFPNPLKAQIFISQTEQLPWRWMLLGRWHS